MHIANGIVLKYLRMVLQKPVLVCRSYITAFTSTWTILQIESQKLMTGIFFHSGHAKDSEGVQMPPICY